MIEPMADIVCGQRRNVDGNFEHILDGIGDLEPIQPTQDDAGYAGINRLLGEQAAQYGDPLAILRFRRSRNGRIRVFRYRLSGRHVPSPKSIPHREKEDRVDGRDLP